MTTYVLVPENIFKRYFKKCRRNKKNQLYGIINKPQKIAKRKVNKNLLKNLYQHLRVLHRLQVLIILVNQILLHQLSPLINYLLNKVYKSSQYNMLLI